MLSYVHVHGSTDSVLRVYWSRVVTLHKFLCAIYSLGIRPGWLQ